LEDSGGGNLWTRARSIGRAEIANDGLVGRPSFKTLAPKFVRQVEERHVRKSHSKQRAFVMESSTCGTVASISLLNRKCRIVTYDSHAFDVGGMRGSVTSGRTPRRPCKLFGHF
jgi:hypothetical protein